MKRKSPPAFQFYPNDWRGSRKVARMTFAQRGMYFEMLLEQWDAGSAPGTPEECAEIFGGTCAEWIRAWSKLSPCFAARKGDGRLVNSRLEAVRRAQDAYRKAQSMNGLRGSAVRWRRHGAAIPTPSIPQNDGTASPSVRDSAAMAERDSSSSSVTSSSSPKEVRAVTNLTTIRRNGPIFKGERLVVFQWQRDDLVRMLGLHTAAFDLDTWFRTLDSRAVASAVVIPTRDGGEWLRQETLAEARRRELPVVVATAHSPAGKQTTKLASAIANIRATEKSHDAD